MVSYVSDRPALNGFNGFKGHASLYEASHLSCLKCGKSMLMDSLFCRHCGTKRGEANFEPSYHLASNRGATGALPTSSLPLEGLYSFPTAGSFVGEPFREGGVASYSSRMPGIFYDRKVTKGGYGAATNDFSWYPPAGPGDTYSGGTMSYGPPPGVRGVQPCGGYPYGDGAPLYQARMPPVQCYGGLGDWSDCHFDPGFGRGLGGRQLAGGLAAPYPGVGPSMFSIPTGSFVADAQMLGFAGSSAFEDKGAARAARAARPSVSKSVQVSPDSPTAAMAAGAGSEANAKPTAPRPVGKSKKKTNRLCC